MTPIAGPHLLHGGADADFVLVAGERQEVHLEAVREAGLGHQRLGLGDVDRIERRVARMQRRRRGHERGHRRAHAMGHDLDDRLLVDRVVQRLADLHVGQRIGLAVDLRTDIEDHVLDARGGQKLHVDVGVGLEFGDAGIRDELGAVNSPDCSFRMRVASSGMTWKSMPSR